MQAAIKIVHRNRARWPDLPIHFGWSGTALFLDFWPPAQHEGLCGAGRIHFVKNAPHVFAELARIVAGNAAHAKVRHRWAVLKGDTRGVEIGSVAFELDDRAAFCFELGAKDLFLIAADKSEIVDPACFVRQFFLVERPCHAIEPNDTTRPALFDDFGEFVKEVAVAKGDDGFVTEDFRIVGVRDAPAIVATQFHFQIAAGHRNEIYADAETPPKVDVMVKFSVSATHEARITRHPKFHFAPLSFFNSEITARLRICRS